MDFKERLKGIRKEKGISQKELAEKAGLSVNAIQFYEYGKYKPKLEQIEKLAGALGVTPYDLIGASYWDETKTQEEIKITLSMCSIDELIAEIKRRCSS